jgi:uncharacterized cupin superfamily protein
MSEEKSAQPKITPIAIEESFLQGKGLTAGDPSEFEEEGITREEEPSAGEEPSAFGVHNFHTGKIQVSVYESEPAKVRIDGALYDEFVQILEGRLILTPDGGDEYEFKQGDSLVVPKGFTGYWHMPEKYRELIIINADYNEKQ